MPSSSTVPTAVPTAVFVQAAGSALAVLPRADGAGLPEVLHWGAALAGFGVVHGLAASLVLLAIAGGTDVL